MNTVMMVSTSKQAAGGNGVAAGPSSTACTKAKGGKPASRKHTDVMPRDKNKNPVTKGHILAWRAKALRVELS